MVTDAWKWTCYLPPVVIKHHQTWLGNPRTKSMLFSFAKIVELQAEVVSQQAVVPVSNIIGEFTMAVATEF